MKTLQILKSTWHFSSRLGKEKWMLKDQRFTLISKNSHLGSSLWNIGKKSSDTLLVLCLLCRYKGLLFPELSQVDCISNKLIFSHKSQTFIFRKYSLRCCHKNILACHIITWQWSHKIITVFWMIFANITVCTSSHPLHMPNENNCEKYLRELGVFAVCYVLTSVKLHSFIWRQVHEV